MSISPSVAPDPIPHGTLPWTALDVDPAPTHPDHFVRFLEPRPDGFAEGWANRGNRRPFWTIASSIAAGWAALSALLVVTGLLLTKVALAGARSDWDESTNRWLVLHRTSALDRVTSWATFLANTLPVLVLLALACTVLLAMRRWREAVFLLCTLALELSVFLTVNFLVERPRPNVLRLDSTPSTGSFPSGHMAATLALWCGTALVVSGILPNRLVRLASWLVALTMTAAVGFARTYRGMHHVTDVAAGAALGVGAIAASIVVVRMVTALVERRADPAAVTVAVTS